MSLFKYHYNFCECGRVKKDTSKRCRVCSVGSGSICPKCGGPKSKRGVMCRSCRFPNIDPEALAHRPWYGATPDYSGVPEKFFMVLAGFLMGEGCIAVGHMPNWSPRVDIGIHVDDIETLNIIKGYLGGSIHRHSNRPIATWRLQGLLPVRELLLRIREHAVLLRSIKIKDVDLVLGYIEWRLLQPHHLDKVMKDEQWVWNERLHSQKVRSSL